MVSGEARAWLKRERCPHCVHRDQVACLYTVKLTMDGWKCCGYRSRHWDERMWAR